MQRILTATGASSVLSVQPIQSVWKGWGRVERVGLAGGPVDSVVVKRIAPGQGTGVAHARKVRSYVVEAAFYAMSEPLGVGCRHARAWLAQPDLFVLEDLNAAGFAGRFGYGDSPGAALGGAVDWLAAFHALHLGREPAGLWEHGTYWHLGTRPDEWQVMEPGPLRDAAAAVSERLDSATHRTWVHGDAKLANFCFGRESVAAVDFQYVGGGVGVCDLVYLLGGLPGDVLEQTLDSWIDRYFATLASPDVETEWRALLPFAWADFERFLAGWAPGHWKRSAVAKRQVDRALARL